MVSNPTQEYNDFIRANLPLGITYDSVRARYVTVNGKYFATYLEAKWYLDYIVKFGYLIPPSSLFANGEQGAWYDPSDLTTLYQDSAGTTPVTDDGDPVGLMLDKRKGLVKGPELVTNGTFDSDLTGWTDESTRTGSVTYDSGTAKFLGTDSMNRAILKQVGALTVGKFYQVSIDLTITSGFPYWAYDGAVSSVNFLLSAGTNTFFFTAQSTDILIFSDGSQGFDGSIDNISVRELPGNHATQSVADARPTYRTDGTLHWLQFDGVDDFLSIAGVNQFNGSGEGVWVATEPNFDVTSETSSLYTVLAVGDLEGSDDPTGVRFAYLRSRGNANLGETRLGWAGGSSLGDLLSPALSVSERSIVFWPQGTSVTTRYNGTEYATSVTPDYNNNNMTAARIGADGFTGGKFNGKIFGLIIRGVDSNMEEITKAESYLARKSGVTL